MKTVYFTLGTTKLKEGLTIHTRIEYEEGDDTSVRIEAPDVTGYFKYKEISEAAYNKWKSYQADKELRESKGYQLSPVNMNGLVDSDGLADYAAWKEESTRLFLRGWYAANTGKFNLMYRKVRKDVQDLSLSESEVKEAIDLNGYSEYALLINDQLVKDGLLPESYKNGLTDVDSPETSTPEES